MANALIAMMPEARAIADDEWLHLVGIIHGTTYRIVVGTL